MNNRIKNLKQKLKSKIRKLRRLRPARSLTRGKIALVLAGGGAKSLSQIGILKVLEKEKIPIDMIVGCSMGSIVGALFSIGVPVGKIESIILDFCQFKQIKEIEKTFTSEAEGIQKIGEFMRDLSFYLVNWFKEGMWNEQTMIDGLSKLISPELIFPQTNIPFFCVATDIKKGKRVIINEGNLLRAVVASVSIPGLFTPIKENDDLLVDGGVLSRMPVIAAEKMGADFIIAISSGNLSSKEPLKALDVMIRTSEVKEVEFARIESLLADFLFSPSTGGWDWFSFSHAEDIIKEGEKEAIAQLPFLKKALIKSNIEKKKLRKLVLPLFY
ncbi:patatin-like phospholipase family protein [bacterium]|nr:patatin-like phospholipase family protein [bacterium]